MRAGGISRQTLQRLPLYLNYLKTLPEEGFISATGIAEALGYNHVQVRKDLATVSCSGRPKVGYATRDLIRDIEDSLGYSGTTNAVLVGAGKLGSALLGYEGFTRYGLRILMAFDANPALWGTTVSGCPVESIDRLEEECALLSADIGIITTPAPVAQQVCDRLVASGIEAIWNFSPTPLRVPEEILVQNENMASSLAVLSQHLTEKKRRKE